MESEFQPSLLCRLKQLSKDYLYRKDVLEGLDCEENSLELEDIDLELRLESTDPG